ncbi:pentapeptide repeat-containing protein [Streptomyces microflavus]|uniref:pentapeptide repeat-containing protein n=1 Tax=Streptomyces microflavus TaxID=1919 RepID=UPI0036964D05
MTNPLQQRPNQDGRHTPNLWPVWLVAPGALLLVGAAAFGLYHGAELLLSSEATSKKPVGVQDVIKTTVTVLTLIGAVLAALYAYRKQLLDEGTSHRADSTQLTERYTKAAEQLGHEQAAVRLAGVYAMARLADDWPEQRQVCVDVLCAYLRMPYETDTTAPAFRHGEREVRLTIIRTIRNHLQDPTTDTTWCGRDLDFTGATFDGGDFSGSNFSGAQVNFNEVTFSGGQVNFSGATFSGGQVNFSGATFFDGQVNFSGSSFSGAQVYFDNAAFSGGKVNFSGSDFSGGRVNFDEVTFSGGQVFFGNAAFSGGWVDFSGAEFSGGRVIFSNATFSDGWIIFSNATFSDSWIIFNEVTFSGSRVIFSHATFSDGQVIFSHATFSDGQVDFGSTTHSGGRVSFQGSQIGAAATINWGPFPSIPANYP